MSTVRDEYRRTAESDVLRQLIADEEVHVTLVEDKLCIDGTIWLTPYYQKIVNDLVREKK